MPIGRIKPPQEGGVLFALGLILPGLITVVTDSPLFSGNGEYFCLLLQKSLFHLFIRTITDFRTAGDGSICVDQCMAVSITIRQ
jgi:hypothetical protein